MAATSERHPDEEATEPETDAYFEAASGAKSQYGRFNLAVIGNTGVGKSSLVNAVFGSERAPVGKGLPVTKGIHYYRDDSLGVWDFEGFEIGSSTAPSDTLRQHLHTVAQRPADEQIAVVWYCVLHNADRLTEPDIEMIRELDDAGLPVILVMTKVPWTRNPVTKQYKAPEGTTRFKEWLESPVDSDGEPLDLPLQSVILTSTQGARRKDTGHGLSDLVEKTLALAPDSAKNSFRVAQQLNLEYKRELAHHAIAQHTTLAAAAAATPFPVADAVTLAPIQLGMMGRISTIYSLELKTMLSSSGLAQLAAQLSGHALARSFLKLIPGAGSAINATVAAAITSAVGEAWMRLCEKVHRGTIDLSQAQDLVQHFIPSASSVMKQWFSQRKSTHLAGDHSES